MSGRLTANKAVNTDAPAANDTRPAVAGLTSVFVRRDDCSGSNWDRRRSGSVQPRAAARCRRSIPGTGRTMAGLPLDDEVIQ